jgi:hypothetical protein
LSGLTEHNGRNWTSIYCFGCLQSYCEPYFLWEKHMFFYFIFVHYWICLKFFHCSSYCFFTQHCGHRICL